MAEIDLLLKLFDTLKDAIKETQGLCHAMLTNQGNIGNYVKNLPAELKDHAKESSDNIGTCQETVEEQTGALLVEMRELKQKVRTMILVVTIAFTLFGAAVFVGRMVVESDTVHDQLLEEMERRFEKKIEELRKTIQQKKKP